MKTVVTNKYILLYCTTVYTVHDGMQSCGMKNSVLFAESGDTTSLFANKEGSSSERRMEGGITDETSMPPLKCECFGSAA